MMLKNCFPGARPPPSVPPQSGISTKHLEFSIVHDWRPSLATMGSVLTKEHGKQDVI